MWLKQEKILETGIMECGSVSEISWCCATSGIHRKGYEEGYHGTRNMK